jgi:8-oxo-dGTP diphosphatase
MMTKEKPRDFNKQFDVVGCIAEYEGKFILLRRNLYKANGGKWGLPAGKLEEGESKIEAILRETKEETGLVLTEEGVAYFDSWFVRNDSIDFEWHMYATKINSEPIIEINPEEHLEYLWVTPFEAMQMDLIHDLPESIELFYNKAIY